MQTIPSDNFKYDDRMVTERHMTNDMFRNRLEIMIDLRQGLVKLAGILPWEKVC